MSGLQNTLHELHQQHKERHEDRREARQEQHGHGGHRYDDNAQDNYGSQQQHHQLPYQADDDDSRRPQFHSSQGQGQGYDYPPPSGLPPSARRPSPSGVASLGGFDRGDFASDADIDRMVATGKFDDGQGTRGEGYGRSGTDAERRGAYGRNDGQTAPHAGQGYGERANEYGRYDAPPGPPPGRGYQSQESYQPGYGSGYGGGPERPSQYGPPQTQGRSQYDSLQGPPPGYGKGQGNAPAGEYSGPRDAEERYGSGYGRPTSGPYRGEAAGYYNEQGAPGRDDPYDHLAGIAQEHGDDPELYRRATVGLHDKIQRQAQSRPQRDDEENDYKVHVDAHRKAYGDDDHGPMDADAIGSAAALEAFKQTAAAKSSNAPAGGFQAGKGSGGLLSKPGQQVAQEEEKEEEAAAARGGGGMQDKLMALAMSQAGKLFDKKNAGRPGGADKSQDKAQAMQSAAATAMQLFQQYQTKGKLDASDMSKVMGLAMNMF